MTPSFQHVAVVGAGAVGCYFGGMLARAGTRVTLIGRAPHVTAIKDHGLHIRSIHFDELVRVAATDDPAAVADADLLLFCVKTLDTENAAHALAPHAPPGVPLVSLQNGVDNAERIRAATGIAALPAVVYVAAEMTAPGVVNHSGRGDLIIGAFPGQARVIDIERISALFQAAAVPCVVSAQIQIDLWHKLVLNCAYNAISALTRARYGGIAADGLASALVADLVRETVAVAQAAGIALPLDATLAAAAKLGRALAGALSSTAQDIERGKPTEIDSLNGYVARRGAELGIATPVNRTLHALIRLLEQTSARPVAAGPGVGHLHK